MESVIAGGVKKGLWFTWELGVKVVLPIYILVTLLTYTPAIRWLSVYLAPVMGIIGLPGEAALPLALGALASTYAGIAALVPLGFGVKELTIAAAFMFMAHDLPIEAAISRRTGSNTWSLVLFRVVMAFLLAAFFNLVL